MPPMKEFPLRLGIGARSPKKNENDALVVRERSLTSFSAVWIQYIEYTNVKCGSSIRVQIVRNSQNCGALGLRPLIWGVDDP